MLLKETGHLSAREIAEKAGITQRFALKILYKLLDAGFVRSLKGASGGYRMAEAAADITVGHIVECIDGPLEMTKCLGEEDFLCTRTGGGACGIRQVFDELGRHTRERLYSVRVKSLL